MSPSLEGIMFNRSGNLSGRRPLLETPGRHAALLPVREHPGPPPPPRRHPHLHQPHPYAAEEHWKPSNTELERRLHEAKIARFQESAPSQLSLDRRDAELIFKFDPHASGEYLAGPYWRPEPGAPPAPAARDGPFVFGVHEPAHFKPSAPARGFGASADDDRDYDYSEVAGETAPSADEGANCCDRINEWAMRDKPRHNNALNRMFSVKDKRKKVRCGYKKKIKCVLVGDGAVGKTSLITAYAQNTFRDEYQPTAYDTYNVVVDVDDRPVSVEICDTAGQESMSELRALCYPGTDVLVLCFSVVRPDTFRSAGGRWVRAAAALRAPLVLVGTQSDLADDPAVLRQLAMRGEHPVTEDEAKVLASKIGAVYVETSAKTRTKLKDAFDSAILAALPIVETKRPFWKKLLCIN